ncbi:MAG: tetratricopeptide repeat protein [Succinivibrionaceae bacterium]
MSFHLIQKVILNLSITLFILCSVAIVESKDFNASEKCLNSVIKGLYDTALQQCEYETYKGNAQAAEMLGYMYLKGRGTSRDWVLSRKFLEKSVDLGNKTAYRYLGIIYWNGLGVPKSYEKARECFEQCITYDVNQDLSCTIQFAKVLSYKSNSKDNLREALTIYKKLFDLGVYDIAYYYADVAKKLSMYQDAYKYAEFFLVWAKRYGDLSQLRRNYINAEKIRNEMSAILTDNEINEGFLWMRIKLLQIDSTSNMSTFYNNLYY